MKTNEYFKNYLDKIGSHNQPCQIILKNGEVHEVERILEVNKELLVFQGKAKNNKRGVHTIRIKTIDYISISEDSDFTISGEDHWNVDRYISNAQYQKYVEDFCGHDKDKLKKNWTALHKRIINGEASTTELAFMMSSRWASSGDNKFFIELPINNVRDILNFSDEFNVNFEDPFIRYPNKPGDMRKWYVLRGYMPDFFKDIIEEDA